MIHHPKLLADLKPLVRDLEADLRARFVAHSDYRDRLTADWWAARDAGRTTEAVETWAETQFTQSAVAWVLACVFVRFREDNGLLDAPLIGRRLPPAVGGDRGRKPFTCEIPRLPDNDYLRDAFAAAARLPGLADVFRVQRSLLEAPVSADRGKQLLRLFRAADADSGALVHDFADAEWNTRFLGDLYQDLSEAARERYALLQTPEFVESFILDRTLTPALDNYALEEVDLIDPTCGSGHFLLGAFERLAPRWLRQRPDNVNLAVQAALDRIAGMDLNPFAVAIARFRLLIAALKLAEGAQAATGPGPSSKHRNGRQLAAWLRSAGLQQSAGGAWLERAPGKPGNSGGSSLSPRLRGGRLGSHGTQILVRKYAVVVGNPPYITVKDRAVSALYRGRFESCSGKIRLGRAILRAVLGRWRQPLG
ncbi:MAG: hypothetical protein MZV65_36830 [Chromatiales bacterium]|nr:hypothetical protein [Chromatiales bacterium]